MCVHPFRRTSGSGFLLGGIHLFGVRVGHEVSDVIRTAHRRGRRVDRVDLLAGLRAIQAVGAGGPPTIRPTFASSPSRVGFSGMSIRRSLRKLPSDG